MTEAAQQPGRSVRRLARAKVNLYLHILGRRADGYHELDSLVAFAEAGDAIDVRPADGLGLRLEGPLGAELAATLATDEDNLALRAAGALAKATDCRRGADIRLWKRLPVAAGIGGGSSDAAAVLSALRELWGVTLSRDRLAELALGLGADVPACLAQPTPVFMRGIGERVVPAPALPPAALLLVNPGTPLATGEVFRGLGPPSGRPAPFDSTPESAQALAELLAARTNDLEAPAIRLAPAIGELLERMAGLPGALLARMSGSGATCFALFADVADAEAGAARLAQERPAWWCLAAPLAGADSEALPLYPERGPCH